MNSNEDMDEKVKENFDSFNSYTEDDADKVLDNEEKIESIMNNETLREYMNNIKNYFMMLNDFVTGKYKNIPVGTISAIIGTLLYVLSPVDLIPDLIPVVGFLDDAAVLALCVKLTQYDVDQYLNSNGDGAC